MTAPRRRYPRYTTTQIEDAARRLLCERFPAGIPIPVDVDYLLEAEPGITLDIQPGLSEQGVPGLILNHPAERQLTVYIDARVADGLATFYRFTVAEELAHIRLHRSVLAGVRTMEDFLALYHSEAYHYLDRNAKRLAGSLLMPEENLRADARAAFEVLRPRYTTAKDLQRQLKIRLAQRYIVSWEAMDIRLRNWPLQIHHAIEEAFERGLTSLP